MVRQWLLSYLTVDSGAYVFIAAMWCIAIHGANGIHSRAE